MEYTGVLADGEEFDSGELEFTLGSGEMIEGFDEAIRGMKAGGEKTFTIPAEKAYGEPDPSMIVEVPLTRILNKTVEITVADFVNTFGEEGVVGEEYFQDGMVWPIKVISISNDTMVIEHMPTDGFQIESPYGVETVKLLDDELEITLEPSVGQTIDTAYGEIKIADADEDSMDLDFNHPLAGKDLTFTVKVVEVTEGTEGTPTENLPAGDVCGQLGIPKSDRPNVEIFIMSYCPYGLQMQKAALPAMELLGEKADFTVKWVSYVMHGLKEIEENNNQYCIQNEYPDKYIDYAKCFTVSDDSDGCMSQNGIDKAVVDACIAEAEAEFKTMELYDDKSTWNSGSYPQYNVHLPENQMYGVRGSPTTVINGKVVSVSRSPEDVKTAVCCAFNVMPAECSQTLSTAPASPGIGGGTGTDTTASC